MKRVFLKLLPLILLAFLSLAPLRTEAAVVVPTGPRDGMFDCLDSNLDWGCRIINFLFESTGDNRVYYYKDGQITEDDPANTPVLGALRVMMAFFSNALLIVASIKLLYELIQMTAETAHTGQIGGKNANKLWAPIRLVVAIGLLVPLDTGLNSGQYIVMQMAKWGSGMASQAWSLFAQSLSEKQKLKGPTAPRIYELSANTFKIYMCNYFMDYFALETGKKDDAVDRTPAVVGTTTHVSFNNKSFEDICGRIVYKVPKNTHSNNLDAEISVQLTQFNNDEFDKMESKIEYVASKYADRFTPDGEHLGILSTQAFEDLIQEYQTSLAKNLDRQDVGSKALAAITQKIINAANTQGWTSAGSWFLAVTRAQAQIITGGLNIPEATPPDRNKLSHYPSVLGYYDQALAAFEKAYRPQNANSPGDTGVGLTVLKEADDNSTFGYLMATGRWTIDKILYYMDLGAQKIELWEDDPRKAFGDLGGTNNPFGEIAAIGHKKIRLALDYYGLAIIASIGGAGVDALLGGLPVVGKALGVAGKTAVALSAFIMIIASLFMLAGILLAFVVPLFPFTRFFFAILTWLGSLLEAMILVPFMALAHLTPNGEGFSGPNSRNAYFKIFQVFLRPILCLFGLIVAMVMFYVIAKFLNANFYEATSGIGIYEGGMKFVQKLVYSIIYVGLIYVSANISFKMIEHIPKHALSWMGGNANEESYDDHSGYMNVATAMGGQQLLGQFGGLQKEGGNVVNTLVGSTSKGIADSRKEYSDKTKAAKEKDEKAKEKRDEKKWRDDMLNALSTGGGRGGGGGGGGGGMSDTDKMLEAQGMKYDASTDTVVPHYQGNPVAQREVQQAEGAWQAAGVEVEQAQLDVAAQQRQVTRLEGLMATGGATPDQVRDAKHDLNTKLLTLRSKQSEEAYKKELLDDLRFNRK